MLRAVGATLAAEARQGDGAYRYGGEEFLLILPEQSLSSAATAAERARAAVEGTTVTDGNGAPTSVTISIGVAGFQPDELTTTEEVLKRADLALYQAKAAGRNRVVVASRR